MKNPLFLHTDPKCVLRGGSWVFAASIHGVPRSRVFNRSWSPISGHYPDQGFRLFRSKEKL